MTKIADTDLDVFPLCLGGNVFGWTADEDASFAVLDADAEAGGDFIDTADAYNAWAPGNSGGESERIIGRRPARRGRRDDLVIATKVGAAPELNDLRAGSIRTAVEASLGRPRAREHLDDRGRAALAVLDEVAAAHETTVAAVALAQPSVVAPIAGARTPERLADLLPMAGLRLSGEEPTRLTGSAAGPGPRHSGDLDRGWD